MRKITTAITAAALAFSMLASAVPAAAVVGYDSAYAGESAFVNISAGQTQNFQVFFANTGTTSWQKGTGSQVDLAACLEDKVTCNAQDASEATWNSGWLSTTRYASTVQTITPPGSLGTFSYNITAPTGVAGGIYRFNGDLVLASTGEKIHPDGYYQEANTGAPTGAAILTAILPVSGTTSGGTDVVLTGTGIVCTPAFPTVSFGGTNGVVLSCGATSVTVDSPAHAAGAVTVTLSNTGAPASNGLTYTYNDTSAPTFVSMAVSGDIVFVTFSEPVCNPTVTNTAPTDWNVNNISSGGVLIGVLSDNIPTCVADDSASITTAQVLLATPATNGAFVEVTLNSTPAVGGVENVNIHDLSANEATAPQARQATATAPETVDPTLISATGAVGALAITLNFSEPIYCSAGWTYDAGDITISDNDTATTTDPTVTGAGTNLCSATRSTTDSSFSIAISSGLKPDKTYTVTLTPDTITEIRDTANNDLANPSSINFTSGAGDFTPPTMIDARVANNLGTTDWGYSSTGGTEVNDSFTVTFSETMTGDEATPATGTIQIQDQDGTVLIFTCGSAATSCLWNAPVTTLTVTVTGTLTPPASGQGGTTPGNQIPFNVTTLNGFTDLQGNVPNVLGSSDRLVDYE